MFYITRYRINKKAEKEDNADKIEKLEEEVEELKVIFSRAVFIIQGL